MFHNVYTNLYYDPHFGMIKSKNGRYLRFNDKEDLFIFDKELEILKK